MVNSKALEPSFLRDAFVTYAKYNSPKEQDLQQSALEWLQSKIETELDDGKEIIEQFTSKWRKGWQGVKNSEEQPIALENLPGSYKGSKAVDLHQEDALVFLHEAIPQDLKDDFEKRWKIKQKLQVSNANGTPFMVKEEELAILKEEDPEGKWYFNLQFSF